MVIGGGWDELLHSETDSDYYKKLMRTVDERYASGEVYPPKELIFSALSRVPYEDVRVVIIGQDPYHGEGQANGMAFAVNKGTVLPPSLVNIYKEIESDLKVKMPRVGTLEGWASQGVLLLNTVLTVQKGQPQSHSTFGWQAFTDAVIRVISERTTPAVFILWGANAISKRSLIAPRHLVITSPHPSPLSAHRGFFGSKPFSKTNAFLASQGQKPIDWSKVEKWQAEETSYYEGSGKIYRA